MASIHDNNWPHSMEFTILGEKVRIGTDNARIAEILGDMFGSRHFASDGSGGATKDFWCCVEGAEPWEAMMATPDGVWGSAASQTKQDYFDSYLLTADGPVLSRSFSYDVYYERPTRDTTLELFASHFQRMVLRHLLRERPEIALVHAGAIAHDGRGIIIVAETAGGKSTLSLACAVEGMRFLADDFALVEIDRGVMLPFPRAVRLRKGTCELVPQFQALCTGATIDVGGETRYYVHPERLRPDALGEPVPLTHIIRLQGFAAEPELRPARPADVALSCTLADSFEEKTGVDLLWRWAALVERTVCADMVCGHPLESARALRAFVDESADT